MSNIFIQRKRSMPTNVRNFIKRSGYVRGYFPEMMSHASDWVPGAVKSTGSFAWNNMGRLALLASLAAGGYALYNKYKANKQKSNDEDDKEYSKVPEESKSKKKSDNKWFNWSWDDDEDSDSDYDDETPDTSGVPLDVLADAYGYRRTGAAAPKNVATTIDLANQRPGSTIILKTSNYILRNSNKRVNKVKDFLRK